jgi:3-deoxy-D-manno-octulosonic-acid transferase
MTVQTLINTHERALSLLDAMKTFEKRIASNKEDSQRFKRIGLDRVARTHEHRADIADRAFKRLSQRYNLEIVKHLIP